MDTSNGLERLAEASAPERSGRSEAVVVLLTGGSDRPYVFGLTTALLPRGAAIDLIGSDELDFPEFRQRAGLTFLNLRGSTESNAGFAAKIWRILAYYVRLMLYAATARPKLFHILWNNKFENFDRTVLMLYYKLLRKKIVFTAHNVNARRRDSEDSRLNRLTLRMQYRLADQIFVHTGNMKSELVTEFTVRPERVMVIPFGINNAVPNTSLTAQEAKQKLGIRREEKVILFFGRIAPYKGLEFLVHAFAQLAAQSKDYRLVIAGRPDRCDEYWSGVQAQIQSLGLGDRITVNAGFIPDSEVEVYFKAADALILPYRDIYQSGVLFLAQSFGLPVLAANVGSLKDDIEEGKTGFVFRPEDAPDLAATVDRYFSSELYVDLETRRSEIRAWSTARHSWDVVGDMTIDVYARLLGMPSSVKNAARDASGSSAAANALAGPTHTVPVPAERHN